MSATTEVGPDLRSDAELIAAARTRDAEAFGALYERHSGAALVVARQHTDSAADADDVVADAFTAVWGALQRGTGPTEAFRAYLFTVVRRVASARRDSGRRTQPTDDVAVLEAGALPEADAAEPALAGLERSLVARAFASLPERWQAVLWHSEVEGLQPAQIAPLLGLTANSAAALAYRAREGLRQAYLQQHLNEPLAEDCRAVSGKLGAYVRRGLGARDTRAVEAHLDECGRCRALVLELGDVSHGMRGVIAPLVLGLVGMGALGHVLPIGGGLAAGWASLEAGAVEVGGAAAGGAGAAGAGASGAAGAGAAGSGAAGAGAAAGIGGLLAAIPTTLVAAVVAVAVVVAGVVGAVQLLSSRSAGSTVAATGPAPVATDGVGGPAVLAPDAAPGSAPTPGSTTGLTPGSTPGLTPGSAATDGSTSSPDSSTALGAVTADVLAGSATSSGTSTPGSSGTSTGSGSTATTPTGSPSTSGTQPTPAALAVQTLTTDLTAGTAGPLSVTVANTGGATATGLVATASLPAGMTLAGVDTGALSPVTGRFAPLVAVGWVCGIVGGQVRCTLGQLPGSMQLTLTLSVAVDEGYVAGDGSIAWSVWGDGLAPVSSSTLLRVTPSPARLVATGTVPQVSLVTGRTVQVAVPLMNAGGTATTAAAPAVVDAVLPPGVAYAGVAAPWTCTAKPAGSGTIGLHCADPSLGARAPTTLLLSLRGDQPVQGQVQLQLGPAATHPAGVVSFGFSVVTPS